MRLLLDEHYPKLTAEQLRDRGHDAVAVTEREDLRALDDEWLLEAARSECRTLLTEDVADFIRLVREGESDHFGLLFSSSRSMPRRDVGVFVRALARLMDAHQGDDAMRNRILWLEPAPPDG